LEQQNQKHGPAHIQMKIIRYLCRIFVCLPMLSFQSKSKTKPDPCIAGSSRTREQLSPPSSLFSVRSPGDQLHMVALRPTDSQGQVTTRVLDFESMGKKNGRSRLQRDWPLSFY
jgi:hypothetical protein